MKTILCKLGVLALLGAFLGGCVSVPPYDYTNYRQHNPRSILVLPPLNESTAIESTYGYLSTVTFPLTELGYYVYPVAVIDQFLKENGMPTAGEMHQIPLAKIDQIIGADAVLYLSVQQYGSKYQVINSTTIVSVRAKMVDVKSGITLWEGAGTAQESSGGSGNIIGDLVAAAITQAINSGTDRAHEVAKLANVNLFQRRNHGLLLGPRHPEYGKDKSQ